MVCCSLKEQKENYSGIEKFFRFSFFRLLHLCFLSVIYLRSLFDKKYKKIFIFYKGFYRKACDEIKKR